MVILVDSQIDEQGGRIPVGEKDILRSYEKAEIKHKGIAGSVLKVIPGVAQMSTVEEPECINEQIFRFSKR